MWDFKNYCITCLIVLCHLFRFDISQCEICKSPMQKPVEMPCEHVCCMTCANGWFANHNACPICREDIGANFRIKVSRKYRYSSGRNSINGTFPVFSLYCRYIELSIIAFRIHSVMDYYMCRLLIGLST